VPKETACFVLTRSILVSQTIFFVLRTIDTVISYSPVSRLDSLACPQARLWAYFLQISVI
jgi:mono/diheme cytochrome c family protein